MFGWVFIENIDGKIKNSKKESLEGLVQRFGSTGTNWFDLIVQISSVKWFELARLNGSNWFSSVHRCGSGFLNQFSGSSVQIESVQWFGSGLIFFSKPTRTSQAYRFKLDCWTVQAGSIFFRIGLRFGYE